MRNSMVSRGSNGLQRRLFEKRCMRRKCYKKIVNQLKEIMSYEEIDAMIMAVQSGKLTLDNQDLQQSILSLGKMDKDISRMENKLNAPAEPASGPDMS